MGKKCFDRVEIMNKMSGHSNNIFNEEVFDNIIKTHNSELNIFMNSLYYLEKKHGIIITKEDVLEPDICDSMITFIVANTSDSMEEYYNKLENNHFTISSNINNNYLYITIIRKG